MMIHTIQIEAEIVLWLNMMIYLLYAGLKVLLSPELVLVAMVVCCGSGPRQRLPTHSGSQ